MQNLQVKQETRVPKVKLQSVAVRRKLNGLLVAGQGTSRMLPKSASSTPVSLDGVHTKRSAGTSLQQIQRFIPVIGMDRKPLMPTIPWRAAKWIKSKKATPFWSKGVFCVRMNVPTGTAKQPIACGIDPGSKKEGFTVKSAAHTFINLNVDAVTWVKEAVEIRRNARRTRRFRKTPYRTNRMNRARGSLPPSTKSRWQWKLRLSAWLRKLYLINCFVVEDVKAKTTRQPKWNSSFSPVEIGKAWFYSELSKLEKIILKLGWETKELRDHIGFKKSSSKMENVFSAHCVDSWVLANSYTGGNTIDNKNILIVTPIRFHRRKLHVMQPTKGNVRKPYGGTRSLGFKRGSVIKHPRYGKVYIGGTYINRVSLHSLKNGNRVCRRARPEDCKFLTFNSWR